jgi:VWFA-related protein
MVLFAVEEIEMRTIALSAVLALGLAPFAAQAARSQAAPDSSAPIPAAQPAAQAAAAPGGGPSGLIELDVVVTDKSGAPVAGLEAADFKLLDNQQERGVVSVRAAEGGSAAAPPVEVILLLDAINMDFNTVGYERKMLTDYLGRNGGHLSLPTSLIFLTDTGAMVQDRPLRDGATLTGYIKQAAAGLPIFAKGGGVYSAEERWRLSLKSLNDIIVKESAKPGRKLLIWLSSGWPAFSEMTAMNTHKNQEKLFESVAAFSTNLRRAGITLYAVDPSGAGQEQTYYQKAPETENERVASSRMESVRPGPGQWYFEEFLKGLDSPSHADYGDLLLGVLATQSGGQVLFGNNDLDSMIDRCTRDAKAYYVLTYNPPAAGHANEYHAIDVQVDKPGLKPRTRSGYYAQPEMAQAQAAPAPAPPGADPSRK